MTWARARRTRTSASAEVIDKLRDIDHRLANVEQLLERLVAARR